MNPLPATTIDYDGRGTQPAPDGAVVRWDAGIADPSVRPGVVPRHPALELVGVRERPGERGLLRLRRSPLGEVGRRSEPAQPSRASSSGGLVSPRRRRRGRPGPAPAASSTSASARSDERQLVDEALAPGFGRRPPGTPDGRRRAARARPGRGLPPARPAGGRAPIPPGRCGGPPAGCRAPPRPGRVRSRHSARWIAASIAESLRLSDGRRVGASISWASAWSRRPRSISSAAELDGGELRAVVVRGPEHLPGLAEDRRRLVQPSLVDEELAQVHGRRWRPGRRCPIRSDAARLLRVVLRGVVPAAVEVSLGAEVVGDRGLTGQVAELLVDGEGQLAVDRLLRLPEHDVGPVDDAVGLGQRQALTRGLRLAYRSPGDGQPFDRTLLALTDDRLVRRDPGLASREPPRCRSAASRRFAGPPPQQRGGVRAGLLPGPSLVAAPASAAIESSADQPVGPPEGVQRLVEHPQLMRASPSPLHSSIRLGVGHVGRRRAASSAAS